jgi:hypothetical protein
MTRRFLPIRDLTPPSGSSDISLLNHLRSVRRPAAANSRLHVHSSMPPSMDDPFRAASNRDRGIRSPPMIRPPASLAACASETAQLPSVTTITPVVLGFTASASISMSRSLRSRPIGRGRSPSGRRDSSESASKTSMASSAFLTMTRRSRIRIETFSSRSASALATSGNAEREGSEINRYSTRSESNG